MDTTRESEPVEVDLASLIARGDRHECTTILRSLDGSDVVRLVSRLGAEDRHQLLVLLDPNEAADVISLLPEPQAVGAMEELHPEAAAKIIEELPSDERADLVGQLGRVDAGAILEQMPESSAREVRRLASYPPNTAGGLMVTEYVNYHASATVGEVIEDIGLNAEKYSHYNIQYLYVTDERDRLIGVLRMRDLLLSPRQRSLDAIMVRTPTHVRDTMTLDALGAYFDDNRYFGAPVVDASGRLCGVVLRASVDAAIAADRERTYRRSQGIVGGEELRTMPVLLRSRRRLSWLSMNIGLNILSASIIAIFQDTLQAAIALAVFLPIISDMSGCSGNQSVAVSIREMALGVIRPSEVRRVIAGEILIGLINGLALGLLIGAVALLWKGNVYLGVVVGGALMVNTVVAVLIGGSVPLILKRLHFDPALAAGPILTTVTDMCGFFFVLWFATLMLSHLH